MKINRKTILIVIIAVTLLICTCIGIMHLPNSNNDNNMDTRDYDAVSVYTNAANTVKALTNYTVSSGYAQSAMIDHEVFSFESIQNQMIYGQGTDKMNALGTETITVGDHAVEYESSYVNGNAYLIADGKQFHTPMSSDDFLSNQTPPILLDPALYRNIRMDKGNSTYTVYFSGAIAPESWAVPENVKLICAAGTAILDENLCLTESNYSITYSSNGIKTKITAASTIDYAGKAFTVPVRSDSILVESLESIRLLEIACGYALQANTVLSQINENILCQAFGDSRTQSTRINMNAIDTNCVTSIRMNTTHSNSGKADASTEKAQWIQYRNGKYQQSVDGGVPVEQTGVSSDMMKAYCRDYFLSTLIQSKFITAATRAESQNTYRFEYAASESFAHQLCQSASQILYQDPTLLFTVSEGFTVESAAAFLEIDKYTALPVSSGISCTISHIVGDLPYQLQYSIAQKYDLPSAAAARLK